MLRDGADTTPAPSPLQRKHWARALIDRAQGQEIPRYGTTGWCLLQMDDPRRIAACVIAAEAWATSAENLIDDLRHEIEVAAQAHKRRDDEEYVARRDAHRTSWRHLRVVQNTIDTDPRPSRTEYHGGPVPWDAS